MRVNLDYKDGMVYGQYYSRAHGFPLYLPAYFDTDDKFFAAVLWRFFGRKEKEMIVPLLGGEVVEEYHGSIDEPLDERVAATPPPAKPAAPGAGTPEPAKGTGASAKGTEPAKTTK